MTRYRLPKALGGGEYEAAKHGDYDMAVGRCVYFDLPGVNGLLALPLSMLAVVPPPPLWRWDDSDLTVDVPPRRTHVNIRAGNHGYNLPKDQARAMAAALNEAADMEERP